MHHSFAARGAKPRLLVIGQAARATGYARVLQSLCERLHERFGILHFGINYRGQEIDRGWRVLPNSLTGDILGRKALPRVLDEFAPDLVFICHDISLYSVHEPALRVYKQRRPIKVVAYCPVEWRFVEPQVATSLATVDRLVCYTKFGLREVRRAFRRAVRARADSTTALPATAVIPHGVDANKFFPLCGAETIAQREASRRKARSLLFGDRPDLANAFIVLNGNRNCRRKRIDLTIEAFARFARLTRNDAWLYLHMGAQDHGVDVLRLAREHEIADRVLMTDASCEKPEIADSQLNLIYNACDVGLNTATGEGWGLVAFEHAAAFAAQIVPDHSACAELWREAGLLAPLAHSAAEFHPDLAGVIATDRCGDLLADLYRDRTRLAGLQDKAFRHATDRCFDWSAIADRWAQLFMDLLAPQFGSKSHSHTN